MIFLNLFNRLIKRKDVYYKYSTEEQFTGNYWHDGKKIYQKMYIVNANGNTSGAVTTDIILPDNYFAWVDLSCSFFLHDDMSAHQIGYNGTGSSTEWKLNGYFKNYSHHIYRIDKWYMPSGTYYINFFYVKDND